MKTNLHKQKNTHVGLRCTVPHHQAAGETAHGHQKHQEQNNSMLINQLELVRDINTISCIITGLQSSSITPHLDSPDRLRLPLVCTFAWRAWAAAKWATTKQNVGVWMGLFIKSLCAQVEETSHTLMLRACGELTLHAPSIKCAEWAHSHIIGCIEALSCSCNTCHLPHFAASLFVCTHVPLSARLSLSTRLKTLLLLIHLCLMRCYSLGGRWKHSGIIVSDTSSQRQQLPALRKVSEVHFATFWSSVRVLKEQYVV